MKKAIGQLKEFRERHEVKQLLLAQAAGMHASRLSMLENEWDKINRHDLKRILIGYKKLGINVGKLKSALQGEI